MQKDSSTRLCNYHYDPLDRLSRSQSSDQTSIGRFYNQSRLATEIQGLNRHSIFQHGDQLLAQRSHDGKAIDTTLLATDTQRSVLTEVSSKTHRTAAYTAYGHTHPGNGLLSLLGFNGERPDSVTGHYLLGNGYRAFNPVLMRFNSPDSWSPFGKGGINAYAYCTNPISDSDPSGHIVWRGKWGETLATSGYHPIQALREEAYNSGKRLKTELKAVDQKFNMDFGNPDVIKGRNLAKGYKQDVELEPTAEAMSREATYNMAYRDYVYIDRKIAIHQKLLNGLEDYTSSFRPRSSYRSSPTPHAAFDRYIKDIQDYLGSLFTKRSNRRVFLEKIEQFKGINKPNQIAESSPGYITSLRALIRKDN